MIYDDYKTDGFCDEMIDESGNPRPHTVALMDRIKGLPTEDVVQRQEAAEAASGNLVSYYRYGFSKRQRRNVLRA